MDNENITQAYFDDIQLQILHEISKARVSVHIAVAWFTDLEIFDLLCKKAAEGVRVELLITKDSINRNSPIDYQQLVDAGGMFMMVGDKKRRSTIMHNKFCVIDAITVINGSYNWSKQARENWENIVVIRNARQVAAQYLEEFENIISHEAGQADGKVDYAKISARLEALRSLLDIEDDDDIALQLAKLKKIIPPDDSAFLEPLAIIDTIENGNYTGALNQLNRYVNAHKQVATYIDPEVPALKIELSALEMQIEALQAEKADAEKALFNYHYRYNVELGELVRRVLKLRAEKIKAEAQEQPEKRAEYEEAQQDADNFEQDYEQSLQQQQFRITEAEQLELKALFRACSKICHPDLVLAPEQKEQASAIQAQLNEAYAQNDIEAVRKLHEQLKSGIFTPLNMAASDAQRLHQHVVLLRGRVRELSVTIYELRNSTPYRKIASIENMDEHFAILKQQLEAELAYLETPRE